MYARVFGTTLRPRFDRQFIKQLIGTSLPYAANMALGPIYLRVDVVMLSFLQGSVAVGLYEAATSIFYRLNVFARTFNMALMPLMAREHGLEADRTKKYIDAAVKAQFILGIPLTVLCIMLAERLVLFFYGQNFKSSGMVFGMMASIILLRFIDNTLATVLTALGLQSKRSLAVAAAAVFNIGLNLWMIPRYSFIGATITTILTETGFFIFLYLLVSQKISRPFAVRLILKPGTAGALMALVVWWLYGLPLIPIVLLSAIAYLICLLIIGTFTRDEIFLFLGISRIYRWAPNHIQMQIRNNLKQREELKSG
jgi:O-antigen/teichoic acid export membrane protein